MRRREDFRRLRESGRTFRHALFNLSIVPNEIDHNRYGYITGKILGKAVERNRVRRLLREAVRLHQDRVMPGFDVLLIARPAAAGRSLQEFVVTLESLFRQSGIMKAEA